MTKALARLVALAFALLPLAAQAEPITLKLAFVTSDQTLIFPAAVQPLRRREA